MVHHSPQVLPLLIAGKKEYTMEVIASLPVEKWPEEEAFRNAISFCKDWLSGKSEFTVHTSGSTGTPKAVSVLREQMVASANLTIRALQLKEGTKALIALNPSFIAGQMMLVRGIVGRMQMHLILPQANPLLFLKSTCQPQFCALVPLQLREILKLPETTAILNNMKAVIIGGAPVEADLEEQINGLQAPVFATYGMTETVSHIALRPLNGPDKSLYFKAFEEVTLGQDQRGCLVVSGPMTAGKTLQTNDLVELEAGNLFKWIGRIDNVINSGGIKIQAETLERQLAPLLLRHGIHNRFFIAPLPDERLGQKVSLFIEGVPLTKNLEVNLHRIFEEHLERYAKPRAIYALPKFTETPTGKVQRKATIAKVTGE